MRLRIWLAIGLMLFAVTLAGCSVGRVARGVAATPVPTKTLRPTFTPSPAAPTLMPTATPAPPTALPAVAPTQAAPTDTPAPPPTASPTAQPASFTVASATVNVRSGPGTNYDVLGRLPQGQTYPITGKNAAGDWWQFDFNGRSGWVFGQNVSVTGAGLAPVAANIPPAPTARPIPTRAPQPTARPQPPAPTAAPAMKFAQTGKFQLRPNSNDYVSVWCFVLNQSGNGLVGGVLRVLRDGAVVREQPFNATMARGDTGYSSEYLYNDGCKVELSPALNGNYSAYLIEGGNPVSDVFNFAVSGESTRIAIIEWKAK